MLPSDGSIIVSLILKLDEIAAFGLTFSCCDIKTFDTLSTFGESHSNVLLLLYCHRIKSLISKKILLY